MPHTHLRLRTSYMQHDDVIHWLACTGRLGKEARGEREREGEEAGVGDERVTA
jgi:hypothetical protein